MDPATGSTAKGTPIGTASGIVHVLEFVYADSQAPFGVLKHLYVGMCRRTLRGNLFIRAGETPTCQKCLDERDYFAAIEAGFDHRVSAVRRPLGHSPIAGNNAMRYGAQVDCFTCPAKNRYERTIWSTNNSGQMRKAEEYARQHFLAKYRESLAAAPDPELVTAISPARLVELRAEGQTKIQQFVDPHVMSRVTTVLGKRGEAWAAAILGRSISRRSILVPTMPWLRNGEEYTLVAADTEEDKARFIQMINAETGDNQ